MSTTSIPTLSIPPTPALPVHVALRRVWWTGTLAAIASAGINTLIGAAAVHLFVVSPTFVPLTIPPILLWSGVGALGAASAFAYVTRHAQRPRQAFRRIAGIVLLVSFVPDLLLLTMDLIPGTTLPAVVSLMLMHISTALITVGLLTRLTQEK
jgi:hypothetical protein